MPFFSLGCNEICLNLKLSLSQLEILSLVTRLSLGILVCGSATDARRQNL